VFEPSPLEGESGWQFTGNNGITKRITLENAWTGNLTASYTLNGPNKLFVRFGVSPNLLDLMLRGQTGLTIDESSETSASVTNTVPLETNDDGENLNEVVRAWVAADRINHAAVDVVVVDVATATTTQRRRNQAQTHQVEVELTGAGPHIITLGFDQGTAIENPGDAVTDGISDNWWNENKIPVGERVASADRDGDGLTNMEEFILLSDPNNASSGRPSLTLEKNGDDFDVNFPVKNGRTYTVRYRDSLTAGEWTRLEGIGQNQSNPVNAQAEGTATVTDTKPPGSARFYKVDVEVTTP
jgi:hypothetical protein